MLEDGVVEGRIFLMPIGPRGRPWMWASGHNRAIERTVHGYEPTRLRWRRSLRAGDENWPPAPQDARTTSEFADQPAQGLTKWQGSKA